VTIARAPGKLVLSGSYSVLWGAPALVAAVDRFAIADSSREPVHVAEEVLAAVRLGLLDRPCFVDASALRVAEPDGTSRKLGLGSSAAILLATLVAKHGDPRDDEARRKLFADGLRAHREGQGGGSGIDVAASTFGGVSTFVRKDPLPEVTPHHIPDSVVIRVFACDAPAVTASFVARVRGLAMAEPERFEAIIARARDGATRCASAEDAAAFVRGLDEQRRALADLGDAAGVPIVTSSVAELGALASAEGGVFLPSGAGGGDIAYFAGRSGPSDALVKAARERRLTPLDVRLGAPGASTVPGGRA
jgi:phosphomevalonate kinase